MIVRNISPAIRDSIVEMRDYFRIFPRKALINNDEFTVLPDKFWLSFNRGTWEPQLREFYKRHISSDKMVIDIGGYIGPSVFLASSYRPKKIIVVEADPINFEKLKKNCELNSLQDEVELHHYCIFNKTGETVRFGPMDRILPHPAINGIGGEGSETETISFQKFLSGCDLDSTNIVKIDIEGGERFISEGLDYIAGYPGIYIYLALHPPFWPEKEEIADMLLGSFERFDIFTDTEKHLPKQKLRKMILSDQKTYYAEKRGLFFDIILKTKE